MDESINMVDHPENLLSLIDMSSEDDLLRYSRLNDSPHRSSADLKKVQSSELLEAMNDDKVHETVDYFENWEHQSPQLIQPLESVLRKNGKHKYNMRKSLAWDSAFFNSAGVLDPEELSSMIGGVEKFEKSSLHAIQEDVPNSDDSIPALESDTLSVASADGSLFQDARDSIQKSPKVTNASNSGASERKSLAARNMMENAIASKKTSRVYMVGPGKLFKQGFVPSQVPQVQQPKTIMAIRSTKPDCTQTSVKVNPKSSKPYPRNSNDPNKDSGASRNVRNGQGISQESRHQMPPKQPQANKKCQFVAEIRVIEAGASMKDVRPDRTNI